MTSARLRQKAKGKAVELNTQDIQTLKHQLAEAELRSRELSKRIGQTKKSGDDAQELIKQKKAIQQNDIAPLKNQLDQARAAGAETKPKPQPIKNQASKSTTIVLPSPYLNAEKSGCKDEQIKITVHEWQAEHTIKCAWQNYIHQHAYGGIYYSWEFLSALHTAHQHRIILFVAQKAEEKIVGCVPVIEQKSTLFGHLWTSIALVNYGGIIADNALIEEQLLNTLTSMAKEECIKRLEVRGLYQRPVNKTPENVDWAVQTDKASMWLPLPKDHSSETLLKQFKAKLRSQIKKGYTDKVRTRVGRSELLEDFYTVFARNMRDLGTPVYDKNLFQEIVSALHKNTKLVIIYHEDKPASAAFLILNDDRMEIPWASTIRDYNRFGLNMVLYWEVLKYACEQKCSIFDFGRSSIDASTYKFKKQWGAQAVQHYWYAYEPSTTKKSSEVEPPSTKVSTDNPKFKLLIACWKRLPVWLSKISGPHIVKFIP